jgi:capsular exopolysaccharide synthesis family protein
MHGDKVLMVTSLMENEGKSTIAGNLALAMAQKYERVLLIDCDLRKPACHAIFKQKNIPYGVRDVLSGRAGADEAIIQDRKSNLYLLLEKRGNVNSGDFVSSGAMAELLDWARNEFDFVVLDLPPMGEVSDAEGMTAFADASLLVVRQNVAHANALNKAVEALDSGKAKLLGCVLNDATTTTLSIGGRYGYGYGYGYGKYGHYGNYGAGSTEK